MTSHLHVPVTEPLPAPGGKARRMALLFMTLVPLAFGVLAVLLGQDANWDLRNYHWYNAYAFVEGRHGFDLLPSQTPFFYNPTIDVPFYLLATHVPAWVAGFALGAVQGLNFTLLFLIAHSVILVPSTRRRVLAAAALALLGMLGGGGIAMIGTTFYDNIVSLGIFASALLVVVNINRLHTARLSKAVALAFVFGLPAGVAMGLKLTIVAYCVGLVAACFVLSGSILRRFLLAFGLGLGITVGLLAAQAHWMLHLWTHYQSPLFPYFNQLFGSPFAPPTSARDVQFIPADWKEALAFPFVFSKDPLQVGEIAWRDWRIVILYVLLPLCAVTGIVAGRRRDPALAISPAVPTRFLLTMGAAAYLVWLSMFGIYRYLVPLEMIAPIFIVLSLGLLPVTPKTKSLLAIFVLLVVAASIQPGTWGRLKGWNARFIQVGLPPIEDPAHTMLLMAGFEPYAHVVPAFPPEMPVIRVQSNFASPDETSKGINKVIAERVTAHQGGYLLLIPQWQLDLANEALRHFGLAAQGQTCVTLRDDLYEPPMLCKVERFASSSPSFQDMDHP